MKNFKEILEGKDENVLFDRYIKVFERSEKIQGQVYKLGEALEKIQKVMKKKGIKELKNKAGYTVLSIDEEPDQRAWSMVSG